MNHAGFKEIKRDNRYLHWPRMEAMIKYRRTGFGTKQVHMNDFDWITDFPNAVTVCDLQGIVLAMNDRAAAGYREYGGSNLVGKSLIGCHPEPSQSRLLRLLQTGERNVYTIEKNGIRKLIHQAPWYHNEQRCGMIELVLEIPPAIPHFVRG
jgi:transcriptional regulator with PAS, ATPase and Fis domain